MENEEIGNSELNNASKKCKQHWIENKENFLLSILEELVLAGYKERSYKNFFKNGIQEEVIKRIQPSIPDITTIVNEVVNKIKRCR